MAVINEDEQVRLQSSSGGIFPLLAEKTISDGGVVFGARFDDEWQVRIDYSETKEGLAAFRGSKYIQSSTADSYEKCECFLKEGKPVLYSGTPCQIAGLKHFLRKEYDNLLTVDVVCHGVPSPKVWKMYLNEVAGIENVTEVSMRDKANGWRNFQLTIRYERAGKSLVLSSPLKNNDYLAAYLKNMISRPSCYRCKARDLRSGSDITLGDYWGIEKVCPEMNDDKGTSLVLINSGKGKNALDLMALRYKVTSFEEVCRGNYVICRSPRPWPGRQRFFKDLDTCGSVAHKIRENLKPTVRNKVANGLYKLRSFPIRTIRRLHKKIMA